MRSERDDRTVQLLGDEGFARLASTRVTLIGCGGLGTHVAQQLAYLGVGSAALVDDEDITKSNLNRYVGVLPGDIGRPKVEVIKRLMLGVRDTLKVNAIQKSLQTRSAFEAIKMSDWVIGCLDNDGARLVLTHVTAAYEIPYIDIASDVDSDGGRIRPGGRLVVATGDGCPYCLGAIDPAQASRDLATPEARTDRAAIYGVDTIHLEAGGPAVVSVNGVIASLAVTELLLRVTGLQRSARHLLTYRADLGKVSVNHDPRPECLYCDDLRGKQATAGAEDYVVSHATSDGSRSRA